VDSIQLESYYRKAPRKRPPSDPTKRGLNSELVLITKPSYVINICLSKCFFKADWYAKWVG